jgi:hypothetical protein
MIKNVSAIYAELADREAIRDCLYRYCRGIDRCDVDILRSAYWPDATDDHGLFKGNVDNFIEWSWSGLQRTDITHHLLGNILIAIERDVAHVESYVRAYHRMYDSDGGRYDLEISGRYVDRMERRNDEWRIGHRVVIRDGFRRYPDSADWTKGIHGTPFEPGLRSRDDRSYELPKQDA